MAFTRYIPLSISEETPEQRCWLSLSLRHFVCLRT
jgi:hypothetical protein